MMGQKRMQIVLFIAYKKAVEARQLGFASRFLEPPLHFSSFTAKMKAYPHFQLCVIEQGAYICHDHQVAIVAVESETVDTIVKLVVLATFFF
jgi:hypothetical protein